MIHKYMTLLASISCLVHIDAQITNPDGSVTLTREEWAEIVGFARKIGEQRIASERRLVELQQTLDRRLASSDADLDLRNRRTDEKVAQLARSEQIIATAAAAALPQDRQNT